MHARSLALFMVAVIVLSGVGTWGEVHAATTVAAVAPGTCAEGTMPSQSRYKICLPALPQSDLVIWVHGYKVPADPLSFQDAPPENVTDLSTMLTGLGYSYATTTYRSNGLVVQDAKQDILELLTQVKAGNPEFATSRVYLIGASMGGLIATQLAESNPNSAFSGALALCGIVGDFPRELNYWGNYNVLFHAFYKDVVTAWGATQPDSTTTSSVWDATYKPSITSAVMANTAVAQMLLTTSKAVYDTANGLTAVATIQDLAYFSMLSANDAAVRLGGNSFENSTYWYSGTPDDWTLNQQIARYSASPTARQSLAAYATTGQPNIPMVVVHTTLDPIVPLDQTLLYMQKVQTAGNTKVSQMLVDAYGHCNFTPAQLTQSFTLLVSKVTGMPLPVDRTSFMTDAQVTAKTDAFLAAEKSEASVQAQHSFTRLYIPLVVR